MRLVVGLGNPGPKYKRNRHNVGFMVVDEIVRRHGFDTWRGRFQGMTTGHSIAGEKVMLLKPATFMNESGRSVGEAMRFFKLEPSDVTVIYDELDLAPTKVRVKLGGGTAGHNGLRSIDAHIGPDFWRVRIGIGHPGDKTKVSGHVLSDFSKAEWPEFERLIDAIAGRVDLLAQGNASDFMSKLAMDLNPPEPKSGRAAEPALQQPAAARDESKTGIAAQLSRWLGRDKQT